MVSQSGNDLETMLDTTNHVEVWSLWLPIFADIGALSVSVGWEGLRKGEVTAFEICYKRSRFLSIIRIVASNDGTTAMTPTAMTPTAMTPLHLSYHGLEKPLPFRTYLFDLEPELEVDGGIVEKAILIESLFAQQLLLSESSLFDNAAIRGFFMTHREELIRAADVDELPIFASLSRAGSDLMSALDAFLLPQGEPYEPPYFSSVSPEKNHLFRSEYPQLIYELGAPRRRLLEIAGTEYAEYFKVAEEYFSRAGSRATFPAISNSYNVGFYDQVTREIDAIQSIHRSSWKRSDHEIHERLQHVLDVGRGESVQRRQQLHNAIYAPLGGPVRYFRGKAYFRGRELGTDDIVDQASLEQWRFAVNTIWNWNLVAKYGLSGALHCNWPKVGAHLTIPASDARHPKKTEIKTECKIYYDKMNLDFVREVRRDARFSERIWSLYLSPGGSVARDHLDAIAGVMAKRLKQTDPELLRPSAVDLLWHDAGATILGTAASLFALSLLPFFGKLAPGDYQALLAVTGQVGLSSLGVEMSIKKWMERGRDPMSTKFKAFKVDLRQVPDRVAGNISSSPLA